MTRGRLTSMRGAGFTLVEVLAAVVIFALGAMLLMGLFSRLNRHHYVARQYQQAAWLLDELLEEQLAGDKTQPIGFDVLEGDFGPEHEAFRYRVEYETTADPAMFQVTAGVMWTEREHERHISATTLVYREKTGAENAVP